MSVGFDERVDIRPYSGYADPGLPTGAWIAQAGRAGDASGGTINFDFRFQLDDQPLSSDLYSLEQMAVDTTAATGATSGTIQTLSMDNLAINRALSDQKWLFETGSFNSNQTAMVLNEKTVLPLWLGAPNRDEGDSGLRIFFVNVDLRLYQIILQGYVWGPRSILAPGGPRRPIGGLFP